jgi:hypothetical protein
MDNVRKDNFIESGSYSHSCHRLFSEKHPELNDSLPSLEWNKKNIEN